MEHNVCQMISAGPGAVERRVQHVRQAGQRHPIRVIARAKCPADPVEAQTVSDVLVGGDKNGIIQRNEIKAISPEIDDQRDYHEQEFQSVCLAKGSEQARERWAKSAAHRNGLHIGRPNTSPDQGPPQRGSARRRQRLAASAGTIDRGVSDYTLRHMQLSCDYAAPVRGVSIISGVNAVPECQSLAIAGASVRQACLF